MDDSFGFNKLRDNNVAEKIALIFSREFFNLFLYQVLILFQVLFVDGI